MPSQKKMVWFGSLIFVSAIFLDGCCHLEKKLCTPDPTLIGSWKLKGPGDSPATTLTFREDETFQLDVTGDGIVDSEGTYHLYGNRLKLIDTDSGATIHCFHSGFYNYTIHERELSFEVFAEECAARQEILTTTWESIPMILPKKIDNRS